MQIPYPKLPPSPARPSPHPSRPLGHPCQAAHPRLKTWLQLPDPQAVLWSHGLRCIPGTDASRTQTALARAGLQGQEGLRPVQVASTKVQTQSGGGHSHGEVSISAATPPPQTRPPREVTSTRGIFCSRPLGPGLRALSEAGSSSSHHRLPGPAQRRQRHPPPAPTHGGPGCPEGAATPADHKGPRRLQGRT